MQEQVIQYHISETQRYYSQDQAKSDTNLLDLNSRVAELEYGLNARTKEVRDGSTFATYWRAKEQGYFKAEIVKQNEARLDFILTPQVDLHCAAIERIKKCVNLKRNARVELAEQEDFVIQRIDMINQKRERTIEAELGSYIYRKVCDVALDLEKNQLSFPMTQGRMSNSLIQKIDEKNNELMGHYKDVKHRVETYELVSEVC